MINTDIGSDAECSDEDKKEMFDTLTFYYDQRNAAILRWHRESLLAASIMLTLLLAFMQESTIYPTTARTLVLAWGGLTFGIIASCGRVYYEVLEKKGALKCIEKHYNKCLKEKRITHPINRAIKTYRGACLLEWLANVCLLVSILASFGHVIYKLW